MKETVKKRTLTESRKRNYGIEVISNLVDDINENYEYYQDLVANVVS